jgi:DNA-binding CsgD family transcriptional regulator
MVQSMQLSKVFDGFNVSETEIAVGLQVLQGLSTKEIAARRGVKDKTIKFHLGNLYRKTNVKTRAEFIAKFSERSTLIQFDHSLVLVERRLADCQRRVSILNNQIEIAHNTRRSRVDVLNVCKQLIQNETNLTNRLLFQKFVDSLIIELFSNK